MHGARRVLRDYLGRNPDAVDAATYRDPRLSPIESKALAGFPPVQLVGEADPLLGQSRMFAAELQKAGVPVELREYAGMPHGFLPMEMLARARRRRRCGTSCMHTRGAAQPGTECTAPAPPLGALPSRGPPGGGRRRTTHDGAPDEERD